MDEGWYVGRLKEIPGVLSQGESLAELEENIRDAYQLVLGAEPELAHTDTNLKEIEVEV
jgi:predicted RNase H-like HicB family nuclease